MTEEKNLTIRDEAALTLISSLENSLDFPLDSQAVDWSEIRDVIAPEGEPIKAENLVGTTFAIYRCKPFPSAFEGTREMVYWVVGRMEDGTLFNTVFGGLAVCDVLDRIMDINRQLFIANSEGDEETVRKLIDAGAGRPVVFTLERKSSARGRPYYFLQ
jgi:hypothetical protein